MSFKFEGTFTIRDGDKILRVAKNNLLYSGARAILKYLGNLHAAEYTNGIQPNYILIGEGNTPNSLVNPFTYTVESYKGLIAISTRTMNPSSAPISDPAFWNHIRFTATLASGNVYLIRELALGVFGTFPTSPTQYSAAVIARAIVSPAYLKEAGATKQIDYDLRIVPA